MLNTVFHPLLKELKLINKKIDEISKIKKGTVNDLTDISFDFYDINLRPALTLFTAQTQKGINAKTISFAILVQLIYLSSLYHQEVPNSNSNVKKEVFSEKVQFPVLVGDYLYSSFFSYLCSNKLYSHIPYFAQLILDINDAKAKRLESLSKNTYIDFDTVSKEREILFESCCLLGAQSVGVSSYLQDHWKKIGKKIGRIEASIHWQRLPENSNLEWEELLQLIDMVPKGINTNQLMFFLQHLCRQAGWNTESENVINIISV